MFVVKWQDWRRWTLGVPRPKVEQESFTDQAAAQVRYNELKAQGIMATLQPLVVRVGKQTALRDKAGNKFNKAWKLHK